METIMKLLIHADIDPDYLWTLLVVVLIAGLAKYLSWSYDRLRSKQDEEGPTE